VLISAIILLSAKTEKDMSNLIRFVFYLDKEDAELFKEMVDETGLGVSSYIRFHVVKLLEEYRKQKQTKGD
jgi:hypothetical protein